jgi:arylsulfatase A-like enzyme
VNQPGYIGILNDKVKTVASRLKQNGYKTYIAGRWYLGHTEKTLPSKRVPDRSFILDASGADNYEQKAYLSS